MSDPALGTNAVVAFDTEQSWGVAKAVPVGKKLSVLSNSITGTQEQLENPSMGGDFNPLDATAGKKAASGAIVFIPTVTMFPAIWDLLTGAATSTGSADPYAHVYKLTANMPKSAVIETDFLIGVTHKYQLASGCRINRLSIPIEPVGFMQCTADIIAKNVVVCDTPYDATLTDWALGTPLDHLQLATADVMLGDTLGTVAAVGYIIGGTLDINANLYADDYRVGAGGSRGSLVPGRHTVGGSLKMCLDSVAVMTLMAGGTAHALTLKWTTATNRTVLIELPRVIFQISQPALTDAGPVIVDAQFRCSKDGTVGSSIRVTITNDQAGTVYA